MSKYRVLKRKKEGYYEIYTVQERQFFFFWVDVRSLDTLKQAQQWIKDQKVTQVSGIVHEE